MNKDRKKEFNAAIDPWVIVKEIGNGASGTVYEVKNQERTEENRALKIICIPDDSDETELKLQQGMNREALSEQYHSCGKTILEQVKKVAVLGSNPNIVTFYEAFMKKNPDGIGYVIYLFMDLLTPLYDVLTEKKNLTSTEVLRLGVDICRGLSACHHIKMLHRDVKPGNILLDRNGAYQLADFGVARFKETTVSCLTRRGTECYMAPEILGGKMIRSGNFNSDLFSLGVLMFQLLNDNRLPSYPDYPAPRTLSDEKIFMKMCMEGALLSEMKRAEGTFAEIVKKACHPDPRQRYQSADEMKEALAALNIEEITNEESGHISKIPQRIAFGRYPQRRLEMTEEEFAVLSPEQKKDICFVEDTFYRREPIVWQAINHNSCGILLLSEKVLDAREYHTVKDEIEWQTSTLRSWLNGYDERENDYGEDYSGDSFITKAFSAEERRLLQPSLQTEDYVFLLSDDDVWGVKAELLYSFCKKRSAADFRRIATPTDYAAGLGVKCQRSEINIGSEDETGSGMGAAWWLRSAGFTKSRARFVDMNGRVAMNGATVYCNSIGIRPVVAVEKKAFQKMIFDTYLV